MRFFVGILVISAIIYIKFKFLALTGAYLIAYYIILALLASGFFAPTIFPLLTNINTRINQWLESAKEEYKRGTASASKSL